LIAGFVFNNPDTETMKFDQRERKIGDNTYNGEIMIVQQRQSGFVPAIGFGYRYDFDNGISLNTNIAAGIFNQITTPQVEITGPEDISQEDLDALRQKIIEVYQDNFHNHYHIFNLGILYRFK
jgi:hypothetical protein